MRKRYLRTIVELDGNYSYNSPKQTEKKCVIDLLELFNRKSSNASKTNNILLPNFVHTYT